MPTIGLITVLAGSLARAAGAAEEAAATCTGGGV